MSLWSCLFASLLSLVAIPVYVKQNINFFETGPCGRLDITIGPKQTMGKTVENLKVTIHMPKSVLSANLTATQGNYTYDLATKVTVHRRLLQKNLKVYLSYWDYVLFLVGFGLGHRETQPSEASKLARHPDHTVRRP